MAAPGKQDRGEDVGGWPVPPIGRVGQASTWPPRRCFFASDQTGLITGTTLLADGAMTAGHCSVNGTGGTSRTCVRARLYQDGGCAPPDIAEERAGSAALTGRAARPRGKKEGIDDG